MKMDWRDPPEDERPGMRGRFGPVVAELQEHPGQWGVIRQYDKQSSASTAVTNLRKQFSNCEFRSAKEQDKWTVFGKAS